MSGITSLKSLLKLRAWAGSKCSPLVRKALSLINSTCYMLSQKQKIVMAENSYVEWKDSPLMLSLHSTSHFWGKESDSRLLNLLVLERQVSEKKWKSRRSSKASWWFQNSTLTIASASWHLIISEATLSIEHNVEIGTPTKSLGKL